MSPPIAGLLLAGDAVVALDQAGRLRIVALADGKTLATRDLPAPVWDGLAAANGRLYLSTQSGDLVCLGKK